MNSKTWEDDLDPDDNGDTPEDKLFKLLCAIEAERDQSLSRNNFCKQLRELKLRYKTMNKSNQLNVKFNSLDRYCIDQK